MNISILLALEPQLVVVDAHVSKLAGDDVDEGGPGRHRDDLHDRLAPAQEKVRDPDPRGGHWSPWLVDHLEYYLPRVLRGFEVPVVVEWLEDGRLAALLVQPDVEVQHVSPGHLWIGVDMYR